MRVDLTNTGKLISGFFFAILPWWLAPTPVFAQTTVAYNASAPLLPSASLTPGAVLTTDAAKICRPGYSKSVRNVPISEKKRVYAEYHIQYVPGTREYEVDHLISLELGGSNDIKNLWPESYLTPIWNAHIKDKLENELHRRICLPASNKDHLSVRYAQQLISGDWITTYQSLIGTPPANVTPEELK